MSAQRQRGYIYEAYGSFHVRYYDTLGKAEALIAALAGHQDAQLVLALAFFLRLGPAELSGLKWGDIDQVWIRVQRNRMQKSVTTPKTKERTRDLVIIDQVRPYLEAWHTKAESTDGKTWVFSDLHNLVQRVIKPHVIGGRFCKRCGKIVPEAANVEWKGLYAGRRGMVTWIIEQTGNAAVAQRNAGHKRMTTTLNVYKKQISEEALVAGMRQLK